MNLKEYFDLPGKTQQELAEALGITQSRVSQLITGAKPINPERCVAIEKATNGMVTRQELRPDDWKSIWPELADNPVNKYQRTKIRREADKADRRNRELDK